MIRLREMTAADVAQIRCWPPYPGDLEPLDYALREQGWLDDMAGKQGVALYAAVDGGELIGFSLLARSGAAEAEFRIALRADKTGMGLGETIARLTLGNGFQQLALSRIYLLVRPTNRRGLRLYRRLGFTECGECRLVIRGRAVQFSIMEMTNGQVGPPR